MRPIIINPSVTRETTVPAELAPMVREWTDYCHDRALRRVALIVDHEPLVEVGRWSCKPRLRPFVVRSASTLGIIAGSKTLDGAMRIARKLAEAC